MVRTITRGEAESVLANAHHVCQGSMHIGAQEHFYLETNACLVVPKGEEGEMEIFSSTQHMDGTQMAAAKALGVPANRIVSRVKRIGECGRG